MRTLERVDKFARYDTNYVESDNTTTCNREENGNKDTNGVVHNEPTNGEVSQERQHVHIRDIETTQLKIKWCGEVSISAEYRS